MSVVGTLEIPESCPKCGSSSIAYILYGLPDFEVLKDDLDNHRVTLGGCDINEDYPQWHCNSCAHEWGELLEREELVQARLRSEKRKEEKRQEALKRGVMTAYVNENGAVRCPYCNFSFKVKYGLTPEGAHRSCGTFLRILPKGESSDF